MAKFVSKPKIYTDFRLDENAYKFATKATVNYVKTNITEKELRKEYARLNAIVSKRVKRMEQAGLTRTHWYKTGKRINKVSKIGNGDYQNLINGLKVMRDMLTSNTGSVGGINESDNKDLQRYKEEGLDFVNKDNLYDFREFLANAVNAGYNRIYGSDRLLDIFEGSVKNGIAPNEVFAQFDNFVSNMPKEHEAEDKDIEDYLAWIEKHNSD